MININNPVECCGCSACVERCPKSCISFDEDKEGFRYPEVDVSRCIECGLCEKVCPVINENGPNEIKTVTAAWIKNETIRKDSSSGGVFTAIAADVLNKGGVVFGARYDERYEVCHSYVEMVDQLALFRGSKYMQSRIGNSYLKAEQFLKQGREVLFTGTPCQIAGLKLFLRKDYENLYTVDIICHGVPSPKVWRKYLDKIVEKDFGGISPEKLTDVNFRFKDPSWTDYKLKISTEQHDVIESKSANPYNQAFNMNVTLRPICYSCPFKDGKSGSDITIADFWGIQKVDSSMNDDRGTSMVIMHNCRIKLPDSVEAKSEPIESVARYNGSYYHSAAYNGNRVVLFGHLDKSKDIISLMNRCTKPSFPDRLKNVIYRRLHK